MSPVTTCPCCLVCAAGVWARCVVCVGGQQAGLGKGTKKDPIILDNTGPSQSHAPGYWDSNDQTQAFEKVCAGLWFKGGSGEYALDVPLSSS
jgi:hypothetical protein